MIRREKYGYGVQTRRTALSRAGLAVVAALVLLVGVLWYEDGNRPSAPVRRPAPERVAVIPPPEFLAATAEAEAKTEAEEEAVAEESAAEAAQPEVAAVAATQDAGLGAVLVADASAAEKGHEAPAPDTTRAPESRRIVPTAAEKPAPALDLPPTRSGTRQPVAGAGSAKHRKEPPLKDGYWLQLGVFDAMDNAERLLDNAAELGLPAHLQARVMVGPFRSKGEADAAMKRFKGKSKGVVLPPQKPQKAEKSRRQAK
jgi:DedD protein